METNFRLYNNGTELVLVVFLENTGDAILRKTWSLSSLNLNAKRVPDRYNMPTGKHKIPNRKSLVRGGIKINILYNSNIIIAYPVTRNGGDLKSKRVEYRYKDLGLSNQNTERQDRNIRARLDKLPIDKSEKFTELDL
jgi:hypothetical protein